MRPLGFTLTPEQAAMCEQNLNLARREAWRFQRRTDMPYDDLESVAFIGLMKACAKFDASKGWKFSTFAVPKCRGELLHYVRDHSYLLRLSHRMRENWVKGRRHLDRGATDIEVAKELGIDLDEWLDTRQACSGAPLELKDTVTVVDRQLEAKEDDKLERLEKAVVKAWGRLGQTYCKNLLASYRFDHLMREHAADTFISIAQAIYDGRDVCYIDCGNNTQEHRPTWVEAIHVETTEEGDLVIHAHDLGHGRIQRSLFE